MLEKVFEMFVQANETLDRASGGMGVGLTLVRTIAELHGGRAQAVSDGPGKGSEFVVVLPRGREAPSSESSDPLAPIAPTKVLIIEDIADSRRMLETMLKLDGYEVHVAEDGDQGLAAILQLRPRFAIVDIGLPGLDGYQVAKKVRETLGPDEVILIALTGYGRPKDREAVKDAGFDEHLIKPLKPDELARALRRRVDGSR
jgi:two-component system CheB/CheR fusion protein